MRILLRKYLIHILLGFLPILTSGCKNPTGEMNLYGDWVLSHDSPQKETAKSRLTLHPSGEIEAHNVLLKFLDPVTSDRKSVLTLAGEWNLSGRVLNLSFQDFSASLGSYSMSYVVVERKGETLLEFVTGDPDDAQERAYYSKVLK